MELRLSSLNDFQKIWKNNFLSCQGLFIPGEKCFELGRELTISITIEDSKWGNIQVVPVWANIHGPATPYLPRGTFLKVIRMEKEFQTRIRQTGILNG